MHAHNDSVIFFLSLWVYALFLWQMRESNSKGMIFIKRLWFYFNSYLLSLYTFFFDFVHYQMLVKQTHKSSWLRSSGKCFFTLLNHCKVIKRETLGEERANFLSLTFLSLSDTLNLNMCSWNHKYFSENTTYKLPASLFLTYILFLLSLNLFKVYPSLWNLCSRSCL